MKIFFLLDFSWSFILFIWKTKGKYNNLTEQKNLIIF